MNSIVKSGKAFELADLIEYQSGKVANLAVVSNEKMKFVLMAFENAELSEYTAPGDAIVFALQGEAQVGYEGEIYTLKAGENFKFDKGARHFIKADNKFKMALLIVLD